MKKLLLRYSERALIPGVLTAGDEIGTCYVLHGGEEVCFKYLMTCNNTDGSYDSELDEMCKRLYGMGFDVVRRTWESRLGRLSGYWHHVEMLPAERAGELAGINSKKESKRNKI